jgi:hypothetical protein
LNFKRPKQKIVKWAEYVQTLSVISAISTGILFAFIRLFEPYLIFLIKKEVYSWFGILVEQKAEEKSNNDSLAAILVQSLNVELVNVILSAITLDHTNEGVIVSKNFNKRQSYKRVEEIPKDVYLSDCKHNLKGL